MAAYSSLPWKAIIYGTRWRLQYHVAWAKDIKSFKSLQPQSSLSRERTFSSTATQNDDVGTSSPVPVTITSSLPSSTVSQIAIIVISKAK